MSPIHSSLAEAGRGRLPCARPGALPVALLLAALAAAPTAPAQPAARPDPSDPQASVPLLRHTSSLARDRRPADAPPLGWREANDTVTRIGGWRAYAREAQQPGAAPAARPQDAAPAAQPVAPAKPMPAGHGGHQAP